MRVCRTNSGCFYISESCIILFDDFFNYELGSTFTSEFDHTGFKPLTTRIMCAFRFKCKHALKTYVEMYNYM